MKIITVIGARPQFVKAAVISREIIKHKGIEEKIIHTGQHYDNNMSDIFFQEMEIPSPDYRLNIGGLSHGAMTGQMLENIESVLMKEKPDWVLVYGDTNSTLAGALAASKLHIKVAHVEAGLRSFNINMPEEQNRILTDRISTILFCPTDLAIENLKKEGYDHINSTVLKSGDVMEDAAKYYSLNSKEKSKVSSEYKFEGFALATIHRAENTDLPERLSEIVESLNEINEKLPLILPMHPRTRSKILEFNLECHFKVLEPVGYFDMIELLKKCSLVFTDSGGLQKEAFFFSKPCITLRDETEWMELVEGGFNKLVGCQKSKILEAYDHFTGKSREVLDFSKNLYGNGTAGQFIVESLKNYNS